MTPQPKRRDWTGVRVARIMRHVKEMNDEMIAKGMKAKHTRTCGTIGPYFFSTQTNAARCIRKHLEGLSK